MTTPRTIDSTTSNLRRTVGHVVVVMPTGRSFDHVLGSLSLERGRSDVNGLRAGLANQDRSGRWHAVRSVSTLPIVAAPHTDALAVAVQMGGSAGGYVRSFERACPDRDPGAVMTYHDVSTAPAHYFLAEEFGVCDAWFASIAGPSTVNRNAAMSGDTPPGVTIFDQLDRWGTSWRWYGAPSTAPVPVRVTRHRGVRSTAELRTDAATGDLAAFTWIEPPPDANDAAPGTLGAGQRLLAMVYNALRAGPGWTRTLLLVVHRALRKVQRGCDLRVRMAHPDQVGDGAVSVGEALPGVEGGAAMPQCQGHPGAVANAGQRGAGRRPSRLVASDEAGEPRRERKPERLHGGPSAVGFTPSEGDSNGREVAPGSSGAFRRSRSQREAAVRADVTGDALDDGVGFIDVGQVPAQQPGHGESAGVAADHEGIAPMLRGHPACSEHGRGPLELIPVDERHPQVQARRRAGGSRQAVGMRCGAKRQFDPGLDVTLRSRVHRQDVQGLHDRRSAPGLLGERQRLVGDLGRARAVERPQSYVGQLRQRRRPLGRADQR